MIAGNTLGGLSGGWSPGSSGSSGAGGPGWPPVAPDEEPPPSAVRRHLADPALRSLFGVGFLLMAVFVTVYNFLTFRLLAPPFALPGWLVGLVFLGYLLGTGASTAAGRLADRYGRRAVLWCAVLIALAGALVTLPDALPAVLLGMVGVTVGFFGAHSVASSWVGRRAALLPGGSPAQASALYLFGYHAGSSVGGVPGGVAFDAGGWPALVAYLALLLAGALVLALRLRHVPTLETRVTFRSVAA